MASKDCLTCRIVESNLNFSPNYVVLRLDLNIIIWIKERFRVFKSH